MVKWLKAFWYEENGVGIIEIILLIVIFREKIQEIVKKALSNISSDADKINKSINIK